MFEKKIVQFFAFKMSILPLYFGVGMQTRLTEWDQNGQAIKMHRKEK